MWRCPRCGIWNRWDYGACFNCGTLQVDLERLKWLKNYLSEHKSELELSPKLPKKEREMYRKALLALEGLDRVSLPEIVFEVSDRLKSRLKMFVPQEYRVVEGRLIRVS
jgi:hypothetical protein